MSSFDVAVLGAGPVGLCAAIEAARLGQRVLLVAPSLPDGRRESPGRPRVESVPIDTLAILAGFGIAPGRIGVMAMHDTRWTAWETDNPVLTPGPRTGHVERALLDGALADRLRSDPGVTVRESRVRLGVRPADLGAGRIIDATGRRSVTSVRRTGPPRPWVGRLFRAPRDKAATPTPFAIAATPDGYAYRLGGAYGITLGLVGRGPALGGGANEVERYLDRYAPWLLAGMPPLASTQPVPGGGASVQWAGAAPPRTLRVGGAALARDALSSQGLAAGLSEALAAATATDPSCERLFQVRQEEQRRLHLLHVLGACQSHRYAQRDVWAEYISFLEREIRAPSSKSAAVVAGRLVEFSRRSALRGVAPGDRQ